MKKTIDKHDFIAEFEAYNRAGQFTKSGLVALFEYLEELEQDTGEDMELDVIALCCEYSDYDEDTIKTDYGYMMDDEEDWTVEDLIQELQDTTTVIEHEHGWIIQEF